MKDRIAREAVDENEDGFIVSSRKLIWLIVVILQAVLDKDVIVTVESAQNTAVQIAETAGKSTCLHRYQKILLLLESQPIQGFRGDTLPYHHHRMSPVGIVCHRVVPADHRGAACF